MTELEKGISDLLSAALSAKATPDEIAVDISQYLSDEYDRQIDAAFDALD